MLYDKKKFKDASYLCFLSKKQSPFCHLFFRSCDLKIPAAENIRTPRKWRELYE